jgi:cold shock CspA family protein
MNGYGVVQTVYRPLGIGVIRNDNNEEIIFTKTSMRGEDDGFRQITEGDSVAYRVFNDDIGGRKLARDVWKRPEPAGTTDQARR